MANKPEFQSDIDALGKVLTALTKLEPAAQQWVLSTAAGRLNVSGVAVTLPAGGGLSQRSLTPQPGGVGNLIPKEFMRQKAPKSDVDRVACLAFFLTHGRQVSAYSSRDLSAMNTEAAGPKINMSRAVDNATKQSGYLTSAGKGKKQITSYGEEVVNALPDSEAVKAVATSKTIPRRKRGKRSIARR